jgi:hypothetical protein
MRTLSALNTYAAPPSADPGNWLTMVNILRGYDVTGRGLRYPPLSFLLLDLLLRFFGELTALKLMGSLAFSIIVIPFFCMARKLSSNALALCSAVIFAFSPAFSEMVAWGAYPQFLGMFFMLWAIHFLLDSLEEPSWRSTLLASIFFSLTVGTHHLTALVLVSTFALYILFHLHLARKSPRFLRHMLAIGVGSIILSLPYLHVYLKILCDSASAGGFSVEKVSEGIFYVFREAPFVWLTLIVFTSLWPLLKRDLKLVKVLFSLVLAPLASCIIIPGEFAARLIYFLNIPLALLIAAYLEDVWRSVRGELPLRKATRLLISVIFAWFIALMLISSFYVSSARLSASVEFYQLVKSGELEALNWIRENTHPSDTFVTSGLLGWWVEGYCMRKSLPGADPKWLMFKDQREEARVANMVLGLESAEDRYELIKRYDIKYILMSKNLADRYQEFLSRPEHFKIAFENEDVVIFKCLIPQEN